MTMTTYVSRPDRLVTSRSLRHGLRPTFAVQPWQVALERRDGEPTRVLPAGRHVRRTRATYQVVDLRERIDVVPAQEVLTADGVTVKVSAVWTWAVADAVAHTERVHDPVHTVYVAVQRALRDALSGLEAEALVRSPRTGLAPGAREAVAEVAAGVGIRLLDVVVKDVVLPADLRAAHAELVVGRHRAQAQLEAARAETAALRSLANGAKLLDDHPALAQLRLVQALPPGSRVEVVAPGRTPSRED
ncbi:SPFH domain-containing protein [Nocardioides okcheonensis]|uniref:SPFH domain-containing protein n=1 Tax=Nocardioides okcheonensis TaxID=2894081 RepID=UPI001E2B507D|nr:SPFH domain-containing protein [Nocardioides okcheonensis]UFN42912.1 slipin family protein [Nocardioides okcheonensis]